MQRCVAWQICSNIFRFNHNSHFVFKIFFSPPFLFSETLEHHGASRGTADLLNIYISHFNLTLSCKLIYIEIYISANISHFILTLSCKLSCFYFLNETLEIHGASHDTADFHIFLFNFSVVSS